MRAAKFNVPSFRKATPINPCLSLSLSLHFLSFLPSFQLEECEMSEDAPIKVIDHRP